jgi:ATP-binding protein involved in chromosome partitioning
VTASFAPPSAEEVLQLLRGVIDPELGGNIVDLGMATGATVTDGGDVTVGVKLTIGGCPLRGQIKKDVETRIGTHPGVRSVRIEWGEMTAEERSEVMLKARWAARENAPDTEVPATTRVLAIASGKGGVGKSSITVNLAAALAAMGYTVGVLDADIWGFSVPRMLGVEGRLAGTRTTDGQSRIVPNTKAIGPGLLKVVSTGLLVEDEGTALMWRGLMLTKAVEQFLRDVQWGELDYLLIDMPPGTGDVQMGLARLLPRTDLVIVTTPALAAQKVAIRAADMARRSFLRIAGVIENMSAFTCEHGTTYSLFGSGGGETLAEEIGSELLGQVPLEAAVAAGGDRGEPVVLDGDSPAARAFRAIAEKIVTETVPPVEMAGCSARLLETVELILGPKPQPTA